MSKRSLQSGNVDAEALPSIPDGGLGTSMPDWLRRPPAWRDLPESAAQAKVVPRADTSPIDPRTILSVDDLPSWLQRIAANRLADLRAEVTPVSPSETVPLQVSGRMDVVADPVAKTHSSSSASIGSSDDSPVSVTPSIDDSARPPEPPISRSDHRPWWQTGALTALLFVCLVIALLVIAYYATGVF